MFTRNDTPQMGAFLRAYHDVMVKPELIRLNELPKARRVAGLSDADTQLSAMAAKGGMDRGELQRRLDGQHQEISQQRHNKPKPPLARALTHDEICTALRQFAVRHQRAAHAQSTIQQLYPLQRFSFNSSETYGLEPTPEMLRVKAAPRIPTTGVEPEKLHAYLYVNGTDHNVWNWTEAHRQPYLLAYYYHDHYACWPDGETQPSIYMKFNSKGIYFLQSSRTQYPSIYPDSQVQVSISAKLTYGQIRQTSPTSWEVWHLTEHWPILEQGGQEITKSDWISGAQLRYVDVPSGYEIWTDVPLFLAMDLTLSCAVRDWAWAIIDLQGWEDLPFWFLFDIWVLGGSPL